MEPRQPLRDSISTGSSNLQDFDVIAPSPESTSASPMVMSSRNSECGDLAPETDDRYCILDSPHFSNMQGSSSSSVSAFAGPIGLPGSSGNNDTGGMISTRQSLFSKMDISELIRDGRFRNKYPELCRIVMTHRGIEQPGNRNEDLSMIPIDPREFSRESLYREVVELLRRLRMSEREILELRRNYDNVMQMNKQIKETYVKIYAKAEQEEEYISNILLKRIQKLKNDKENLAQKYEQEEESLTNDLMKKIQQLQSERDLLEGQVRNDQSAIVDNLISTIRRMENEMDTSRKNMDRMRKEKIDQENALEHEQELLFNTLGKQMNQLNAEKRRMQISLQKAYLSGFVDTEDDIGKPSNNEMIVVNEQIRNPAQGCKEIHRLRQQLRKAEDTIHELRERDVTKTTTIRQLEGLLGAMQVQKDGLTRDICEALHRFNSKSDIINAMRKTTTSPASSVMHETCSNQDPDDISRSSISPFGGRNTQ